MWNRVNVPIGIIASLDNIFSAVLVGGIDGSIPNAEKVAKQKALIAKTCLSKFKANFPFNIFHNSYAIFYEIIVTLQVKTFSCEQLREIIENNRDLILDSPYINTTEFSQTSDGNIASDDDIINAMTYMIMDKFRELSVNVVSEDEFDSSSIIYVDWYKQAFAEFTALNMSAIMSTTGFDCKKPGKRTKHYAGVEDMKEYYNENMKIINSLEDKNRIKSTVINYKWYNEEMERENKQDEDSMFNIGIEELDATIGELRRGNMLGILGPPKGGKTRFSNFIAQRALSLGYNVCVWPLEGTKEEWLASQIACFIARVSYEKSKQNGTGEMLRMSSKDILQKKYVNSVEARKVVAAAKKVIANDSRYGTLSFIEGTAFIEDMFEVLQSHYDTENQFDVLIIDSLVNVMSKKGKGKVERISEAYMNTKNFLANQLRRPALGIMPAQLKQEVVDYLRKNPDETIDVTAGGETSETIRTPDETIGLFSSKEERDNNIMRFYSVASRHNDSFKDFLGKCYLECCFFTSGQD